MNETTTSGAVAPVAGGMGKSMLKRPADSIFAAESVPEDADTGLEKSPQVDSPANFGLWKNSAVIGKEQYGKHGRNKMKVDKTKMYPQTLGEGVEPEQEVIDSTRRSRLGAERNAGLNEPDELSMPGKEADFGTWHFVVDGVPLKKNGEVYYSSSKKHNDAVLAHLKKKAGGMDVEIAVVQGPVKMSESRELPVDMDDWTEEDWAEWDAKVDRVGAKAKAQVQDRKTGEWYDPEEKFDQLKNSPEFQAQMKRMATKEGVAEGIGNFTKAMDTLTGWYQDESDSGEEIFYFDDREGGYYADGLVKHNPQTGEITVDFEDKSGDYGGDIKGTFNSIGDAMNALRGTFIARRGGGKSHNHDSLGGRDSAGGKHLYKTDKAGKKGTLTKSRMDIMKASSPYRMSAGPKGVLPENEQLNELSTDTLKSYKKKAETDYAKQRKRMSRAYYQDVDKYDDASIKRDARKAGIKAAKTRLGAEGVAEGKEDKIAQLKKDYDTAVHWSKNEKSPQKREAARQKAERIKRHLETQYKTKLDEYSEWDGTGAQDLAAATAASGYEAGFADIEDKTSLSEAEITEEMIADRLKNELALMKKGSKPKDKSISKKPVDKEVQPKDQKKESDKPEAKKSEPKKEKSDKEQPKKSESKKSEGKK